MFIKVPKARLWPVLGRIMVRPPVFTTDRMCPLRPLVKLQMRALIVAELMKEIVPTLPRAYSVLIMLPLLRIMPSMLVGMLVLTVSLISSRADSGLRLDGPSMKAPL